MTEGVFPKISADCAYSSEWNTMYAGGLAGYSVTDIAMENAMNITKIEYCLSLTDIPHDYLVVDSFTQNCGYNASVCVASTTSCYTAGTCCLNNIYVNCQTTTVNGCQFCNCCTTSDGTRGCGYKTIGNYFSTNCVCTNTNTGTVSICQLQCSCTCAPFSLTGVTAFGFNACCYVAGGGTTGGGGASAAKNCIGYVVAGNDAATYTCTKTFGASCDTSFIYVCSLNCYRYLLASANCWNFYCNGVCKCQVTASTFPNIVVTECMYTESTCSSQTAVTSCYCLTGIYAICGNCKIQTNNVTWTSPIKTTYLDLDKYGSGTIVYNVVNAADNACLCCNLLSKCTYLMTCCVCCHRYEIVQCNDNISCIKSYAVAVSI